jgi:hypothetical protein
MENIKENNSNNIIEEQKQSITLQYLALFGLSFLWWIVQLILVYNSLSSAYKFWHKIYYEESYNRFFISISIMIFLSSILFLIRKLNFFFINYMLIILIALLTLVCLGLAPSLLGILFALPMLHIVKNFFGNNEKFVWYK